MDVVDDRSKVELSYRFIAFGRVYVFQGVLREICHCTLRDGVGFGT